MNVQTYDPYLDEKTAKTYGVKMVSFDELVATSRFHRRPCAAYQTDPPHVQHAAIQSHEESRLPDQLRPRRTSDSDALYDALVTGEFAGAALDVTEPEPLPADHKLLTLPNVIVTCHTRHANSDESYADCQTHAAREVVGVLSGKGPTTEIKDPWLLAEAQDEDLVGCEGLSPRFTTDQSLWKESRGMKIFIRSIIGFSFCLVIGSIAQPVSAQETKRFHFAVSTPVHYLPVWVAKEAKLYAKHGIDVEVIWIRSGAMATLGIISGRMPLSGVGAASVVTARAEGADIEASSPARWTGTSFISSPGRKLNHPSSLGERQPPLRDWVPAFIFTFALR